MISLIRPPGDEGIIRGAVDTPGCASHAKRWVLLATVLGSSVAFLEASIINVALPAIQGGLGASMVSMQWIASAYTLLLAALMLVGGAVGDRFGKRRLFIWGTAVLALSSLACGVATSAAQLIAGRALQGVGAAMLVPNSLALLSASFPKAERGRAIGTWSAWTALTGAGSPILGGWLVDTVSWRAGFVAVVPLAVAALAVARGRVPDPPLRRRSASVDWPGAALATIALAASVFAIIAAGAGVGSTLVLVSAATVGLGASFAFVTFELHAVSPMVPLALFRSATFRGVNLLTLLLYFAVTAVFFVLPFNLVQVQGYSTTLTGAAYLPFALLVGALSRPIGTWSDVLGAKRLLIVGPGITAAGLALFAFPGVGGSYWWTFFPPMALVGVGMALTVAPLTATVMASVAASDAGVAAGVNNTVARIAALLAVALIGVVTLPLFSDALARRLEPISLPPAARRALIAERRSLADMTMPAGVPDAARPAIERFIGEAFVESFRWVALISAACALGAGIVAAATIDPARKDDAAEGEAAMATCIHLDQIAAVQPSAQGCEECLRSGDSWVHLRLCLSCGHVGCCDSSKNRHATKHFWAAEHPIVRSLEPGENWRWCYIDEIAV